MVLIQQPSDAPIVQRLTLCWTRQVCLLNSEVCSSSFSSIRLSFWGLQLPGRSSVLSARLHSYTSLSLTADHTPAICPIAFPLLTSSVVCMLPKLSPRSPDASLEGWAVLGLAMAPRASPQFFQPGVLTGWTSVMKILEFRSRPK